MMAEAVEDY